MGIRYLLVIILITPLECWGQLFAIPNPEESIWRAKMLSATIKELKESIKTVKSLKEGIELYKDTRDGINDIKSLKEDLLALENLRDAKLKDVLKIRDLKVSEMVDALERAYEVIEFEPTVPYSQDIYDLLKSGQVINGGTEGIFNLFHQGNSGVNSLWELNSYDFSPEKMYQYHAAYGIVSDQLYIKGSLAYRKMAEEKLAIAEELNDELNRNDNLEMTQAQRIDLQNQVQQLIDTSIEYRLTAEDLMQKALTLKEFDKAKIEQHRNQSEKEKFLEHYKQVKYGDH